MRTAVQIAGILAAGIFLAYWRGVSLLDPLFFIAFACLPAMLVTPILADLRRRNPADHELTQLRRAVLRSCAIVYLILAVSLFSVWSSPSWSAAMAAVLLSAAITTLTGGAAVHGLRRFSGNTMKWIARGLFLVAILLYRALPDPIDFAIERITIWGVIPVSLTAAAVAAVSAALLLLPLR